MTLPLRRSLLRWSNVISKPSTQPMVRGDASAEDDLRLLREGQAGSQDALATLLGRHEAALYRLCRGMTSNASDAEDLVQETFLRALRAFDRDGGFRGDATVQTFLYKIALNVCLDARRQARPTLSLEAFAELLPTKHSPPEQTVIERETLRAALAALQPRQRMLLILREQESFSVVEIAALLGWNPKKVDNELYKTRRALAAWRARSGN